MNGWRPPSRSAYPMRQRESAWAALTGMSQGVKDRTFVVPLVTPFPEIPAMRPATQNVGDMFS